MFAPKVTLTREELYEKVWSTPMHRLTAEFGFSDFGFAKLRRPRQVPVPPRGYWARLQVGQTPKRIALPIVKEPRFNTVEIHSHEGRPPEQLVDVEGQDIPSIVIADDRPLGGAILPGDGPRIGYR